MDALSGGTSQVATLGVVTSSFTLPETSGFYALVANVGPTASGAFTAQMAAVASATGIFTVPETAQMVVLAAYATGVPQRNTQRAWVFDLDNHTHYVLDLGTTRTLVFDMTTQQWAQWGTEGYPVWNAQLGIVWEDRIVAADLLSPAVYQLDPEGSLDEGFRAVRRIVTGIVPANSRNFVSLDELHVMCSVGDAQEGFDGTAEMTLRFSDDQGRSFITFGTETLSSTDDRQELSYRSLGAFNMPGRIIEIEDLGGPVRIDSAQVVLR